MLRSRLVARIDGNQEKIISQQVDALHLSGVLSYDPDATESMTSSTLRYAWSCRDDFGFVCKDQATLDPIEFTSTPRISIPTKSLGIERQYLFELEVSKDSRKSKSGVQVRMVAEHVPVTAIICPGAKLHEGEYWINPDQRLILQAACSQCSGVLWFRNDAQILGAQKAKKDLSVFGSDLHAGQSYTYSVHLLAPAPLGQVCSGSSGLCEGFASMRITVNRSPSGGHCTMTLPSSLPPTEMDVFVVECFGFCDEDQPLRYTYGYTVGQSQVIIGTRMVGEAFLFLPAAEAVSVFAIIHDSLGASSRYEVGIYAVQPSDIGTMPIIAKMKSLIMLG